MSSFTSSAVIESDLLTADKKTVDTMKVISKMWEQRKNIDVVNQLANLLCKFVDEKRVFKDIEFFLPQIAHIVIHLDQNSANEALEVLAMVISQTSIHAALQLSFAFSSAMEDYQPEVHTGLPNPNANPFLFARCARLLQDVERAVIYGSCLKDMIASAKADSRKSGVDDSEDDEEDSSRIDAKKREEIAQRLSKAKENNYEGQLTGKLYFKRTVRKSSLHSKSWKYRFFMVDQRVLYCLREPHSVSPLRAISLQNCTVNMIDNHPKYDDNCFEVINNATNSRYQLRATDKALRKKWVDFLNKEINGAPQVNMSDESNTSVKMSTRSEHDPAFQLAKTTTPTMSMTDMTPTQRKRFAYFRQLKVFITNMTNICEGLRFKERPLRKHFLRRDMSELVIPPFVYLPLCTSSDDFYCIVKALPNECHAFTTKARVPALMLFEMEKHKVDTATFLGYELERYPEAEVIDPDVEVVLKGDSSDQIQEEQTTDSASNNDQSLEKKSSRFTDFSGGSSAPSAWVPEGTGLERVEQAGVKLTGKLPSSGVADSSIVFTKVVDSSTEGVLGETFAGKIARIKETSPHGHLPNWTIGGLIAKSNDDVRQEVFVIQLISYYQRAFQEANVPVWLHTYKILSTSKSTGLIELIPNATSIDGLKKRDDFPGSLKSWYEQAFGGDDKTGDGNAYKTAMENYVSSMAAYSIVSYLLAIKDRHNGNIMVDKDGHIIHIDFGFVFGLAPGKAFSMEKAPWKLNKELASVMGGKASPLYEDYRKRCIQALTVARRHAREVTILMEIMQSHSNYPAFKYNKNAIKDFRSRLFLEYADQDVPKIVDRLLGQSYKNQGTDLYDSFQLATNGIAK